MLTSQSTTSSPQQRVNESDDPRSLWKEVRRLARENDELKRGASNTTTQLARLGKKSAGVTSGLHPFKIYYLPPRLRPGSGGLPNPDGQDWLRVRVRAGRYMSPSGPINVMGTDAVNNPDIETYLDSPGATDILVPANDPQFYIWVTFDATDNTAQLYYGDSQADSPDDSSWPAFPANDSTHTLIGWVDSQSLAASNQLQIQQIQRTDISAGGAGGSQITTLIFTGIWPTGNPAQGVAVWTNYITCQDGVGNLYPVLKPAAILPVAGDEYATYDYSSDATCLTRVATARAGVIGPSPQNQAVTPFYPVQAPSSGNSPLLIITCAPCDLTLEFFLTDPADPNFNTAPGGQVPIVLKQISPAILFGTFS